MSAPASAKARAISTASCGVTPSCPTQSVAEMRTDLKSLKRRLDKEMRKLGISEEHAESILTSFYMSLDSQHQGEASPPKKARRASRMVGDDELEDAIPPPEGETMAADAQQ